MIVNHGRARSGAKACDVVIARPSTTTPTVCVAATVAPTVRTCRVVPRRPATIAAINVVPCPGARECNDPSTKAMSAANSPTPTVRCRLPINRLKRRVRPSAPRAWGCVDEVCVPDGEVASRAPPGRASTVPFNTLIGGTPVG